MGTVPLDNIHMPGPVVREIEAKSILNASKIHDY